ncbi:MAG: SRPBCC family protein [Pseudomonadota bacterium]
MIEPIEKTIQVACTPDQAFTTFADNIGAWWPKEAHSVSAMSGKEAQRVVLETKVGGRLYEIAHDGAEIDWGSVRTFDRHDRIVLAWHIGKSPDVATEVEVNFASSDNGTRVTLIHRDWEKNGDGAEELREGYNKGWVNVFEVCFKKGCAPVAA